MKIKSLISVGVLSAVLAGCGSDGVELSPTVIDNSTGGGGNGGGGSADNTGCAYIDDGSNRTYGFLNQGTSNCEYSREFIGSNKALKEGTLVVPELASGGVHIFDDSIFIGENVTPTDGKPVPQEGEGATLQIQAGAKIALSGED